MDRKEKLRQDRAKIDAVIGGFPLALGRDKFDYRVLVRGGVLTGIEVKRKLRATTPTQEGPPIEP